MAACALAPAASAQSDWRSWDSEFDENRKPWKELSAALPPPPRDENLLAFEASGASPHRFFIDGRSVSAGEDGVVRYTLVIRTAGGARNVSFEGIRCETREQKTYAVGQAAGWTRARNPAWRRIEAREVNNHHLVLYSDYFCLQHTGPRRPQEILRLLKSGPQS